MARNIMSTPTSVSAPAPQAPDSPRESESPPPPGPHGDLEIELLNLAQKLQLPYREGFIKNRYVGRTFIMPGQTTRYELSEKKLLSCLIRLKL